MAETVNPLLDKPLFPHFDLIESEHVEPAIDEILYENRKKLGQLLGATKFSWNKLLAPMEQAENRLNNAFSPVRHLNSVMNNDKLREAYNKCLPKLSDYATEIGQNANFFKAVTKIKKSKEFGKLGRPQQKTIDNALRDFKLSGVDLEHDKKKKFKKISGKLARLSAKFSENVLDVTNTWYLHIEDKSKLKGLPDNVLALAAKTAEDKNLKGFVLNLEFPLWQPVMQYAKNRKLRKKMYKAYVTRAASTGPHSKKYDNSKIMHKILKLKQKQARILGFKTYAEVSLESKMAQNPKKVLLFLHELLNKSKDQARAEFAELTVFARQQGLNKLKPWDLSFYSEKLKTEKFNISSSELRAWFPVTRVIAGMFELAERLFGINIRQKSAIKIWHEDVMVYAINKNETEIAYFYLDLYARANKRSGAWMDECRNRIKLDDRLQLPIAYLSCNFSPPVKETPSLLTFEEVTTLFHEFGHGLQHMLTTIDVGSVSGINGVEWDAVELPSQFMENFCWQNEIIPLISAHYETGEPLPDTKLKALLAAKNFQSAMAMLRQLEFAIFDMHLHGKFKSDKKFVEKTLKKVRKKTALLKAPKWSRFANSFSHIFGGGYAAGYYSYKWAEVLSADAFSLFKQNGLFDRETGLSFLHNILEPGGSENALDLFIRFRGREPKSDALLYNANIKPKV